MHQVNLEALAVLYIEYLNQDNYSRVRFSEIDLADPY